MTRWVTDVRDGMDWMGYHHYGSMSEKNASPWPTKAMGFAKTSRYIPMIDLYPETL